MCTSPSTQLSSLFAFSLHSKKIFVIACQDLDGLLTEFKTEQEAFVDHLHVVITTMKLLLAEEVSGTRTSVQPTVFNVIYIFFLRKHRTHLLYCLANKCSNDHAKLLMGIIKYFRK